MTKIVDKLTKKKDGGPSWIKIGSIIVATVAVIFGAPVDVFNVVTAIGN